MSASASVLLLAAIAVLLALVPACAVFFGGVPERRHGVLLLGFAGLAMASGFLLWSALGNDAATAVFQGAVVAVCVTSIAAVGLHQGSVRATLAFVVPWLVLVLVPVALSLFDVRSGLLAQRVGSLDFAGAAVLGICTGVAAVVIAVVSPTGAASSLRSRPTTVLVVSGIAALVGFVALGIGAETVVDESSVIIVRNVVLASGAGALGWVVAQLAQVRAASIEGMTAGLFAGPVCALAGLPWLDPLAVAVIALGGAVLGQLATERARAAGAGQWSLLLGVFLAPATLGFIATGLLARDIGLLYSGHTELITSQLLGVLLALCYSGAMTLGIALCARRLTSFAGGPRRRARTL